MYGQKKKMITGSLKVALGDCFSCKGLNSLLDTPFCPTNYRYIPLLPPPSPLPPPPSGMPFNIDIVIKKTTFNLIEKLPSKNIVTRKQKNHSTEVNYGSILQILVPSLTRIVSSNKSASLKMKFSCHRTKNILSFSREAVFSQQLPSR